MIVPKSVHALGDVFFATVRQLGRRGTSSKEVWRQFYEVANQTAPLVILGMSFFGGVMVSIANQQATTMTGNVSLVGPAYFELLVRELGPVISSLLAASRVSAFYSAEIASMAVNEQIDALKMSSGDPFSDIVGPRLIAGVIAIPIVCLLGTIAAAAAAYATAQYVFSARGIAFVDPFYINTSDLLCGVIKTILGGALIPLTSAHHGLSANGGAPAIGTAVTRGVVESCMGILLIDFVVALIFLGVGA